MFEDLFHEVVWKPRGELVAGFVGRAVEAGASGRDVMRGKGFRLLLRHDGWGTATLQAVRLIAQREIPAYAGMTWAVRECVDAGGFMV